MNNLSKQYEIQQKHSYSSSFYQLYNNNNSGDSNYNTHINTTHSLSSLLNKLNISKSNENFENVVWFNNFLNIIWNGGSNGNNNENSKSGGYGSYLSEDVRAMLNSFLHSSSNLKGKFQSNEFNIIYFNILHFISIFLTFSILGSFTVHSFNFGSTSPRFHSIHLSPEYNNKKFNNSKRELFVVMDVTFISDDMTMELSYGPTDNFFDSPLSSFTEKFSPQYTSWISSFYEWIIKLIKKSKESDHIHTLILGQFHFTGSIIISSEVIESYPFLGNGKVKLSFF